MSKTVFLHLTMYLLLPSIFLNCCDSARESNRMLLRRLQPPPVTPKTGDSPASPLATLVKIKTREDAIKRYHQWLAYLRDKVGVLVDEEKEVDITCFGTPAFLLPRRVIWIEGPIDMGLYPEDGSLCWFRSMKAETLHEEKYSGLKEVTAQKDEEEIMEIAENALRMLISPRLLPPAWMRRGESENFERMLIVAQKPFKNRLFREILFKSAQDDPDEYLSGYWSVLWRRVWDGFYYEKEGTMVIVADVYVVNIAISEEFGILWFANGHRNEHFLSSYLHFYLFARHLFGCLKECKRLKDAVSETFVSLRKGRKVKSEVWLQKYRKNIRIVKSGTLMRLYPE